MLVAITGKAGAGKDTAAEVLIKNLCFNPLPFADALKRSCMFKFGLSESDVYTQEGKKRYVPEWGMTPGEILQKEGTEATKSFWGNDFWIRRWRMDYNAMLSYGMPDIVVPDLRFDEEAQALQSMGALIIRIKRPNAVPLEGRDPNHPSERGIADTFVAEEIINDGSIEQLQSIILHLVQEAMRHG